MIELRHLKTLTALRQTGSLTKAAALLDLTQSALSQQIRLLETYCNGPLFERKSMPLIFTAIGIRLLRLADMVLPCVEEAKRDIIRLTNDRAGALRIAVECHTCFDWLMPTMDGFRARWPEVELDIVSGFHADPIGLLHRRLADLAVVSEIEIESGITYNNLFQYEIIALMSNDHRLVQEPFITAEHFAEEVLITYPVEDDRLDVVKRLLEPAGVNPARRTAELTVAILQLVASKRGIAALPLWAVKSYLDRRYVAARPITEKGLTGKLYGAVRLDMASLAYMTDFIASIRSHSFAELPGVRLF